MTFAQLLKDYDPNWSHITIDFETLYNDRYSVADTTYWHYCHDSRFDAYMVSIVSGRLSFVGSPEDVPWEDLKAYKIWCAHNSPFDRAVFERLQELGTIPKDVGPKAWVNTADLAAYLKCKRNLATASDVLLGKKMSKTIRNDMKGKVYNDIPDEDKEKWKEYALLDSERANELWVKYKDQWPREEQLLSLHTSECVKRGVKVDVPYVKESLEALEYAVDYAARQIPWYGEEAKTPKGRTKMSKGVPVLISPTSPTKLSLYARECDIPMPSSTDVKSKEFQEWEKEYGESFPVIKAIQTWRKCNRLLRVFEHIDKRTRDDGRMEFQLCYFGAHTGRWSGRPGGGDYRNDDEKGLNMQNLPRDPVYLDDKYSVCSKENAEHTINTRGVFMAPRLLGVADLSQIEPRVLANLVGDREFIKKCGKGMSPYEVHARTSMGYDDPEPLKKKNPIMYSLAKARVLALGYQAGWEKFIAMAYTYVGDKHFNQIFMEPTKEVDQNHFLTYLKKFGKDKVSLFHAASDDLKNIWVNSWLQVADYRTNNSEIVRFWATTGKRLKDDAYNMNDDHHIVLPSGRQLTYFSPSREGKANTVHGGARHYFYGGKLTENLVQATARDVHGAGIIRLELAGYSVIWHVHDEVICEIDDEKDMEDIIEIISEAPSWLPHLPVAAEGDAMERYQK